MMFRCCLPKSGHFSISLLHNTYIKIRIIIVLTIDRRFHLWTHNTKSYSNIKCNVTEPWRVSPIQNTPAFVEPECLRMCLQIWPLNQILSQLNLVNILILYQIFHHKDYTYSTVIETSMSEWMFLTKFIWDLGVKNLVSIVEWNKSNSKIRSRKRWKCMLSSTSSFNILVSVHATFSRKHPSRLV
jgi:hypothetical protein